jgi:twinkle protein
VNVNEFARLYLSPYKVKGDEIIPRLCPYCKGGNNHDKESFALNIHKKTFNCKRGSCGKEGNFYMLCKDLGEKADNDNFELYKTKKVYKKPQTQVKQASTQAEKYLNLRKISKETMDLLKVGSDDKGNIVFPYYEAGELVFVKFRPARKVEKGECKSWREEGGKPVLWGMDLCTPELPLIITEGEIDTLALYEAGLKNIVSIPSGAEDFSWVETCWEWLEQYNKIIFFGDADNSGKEMVRKAIKKLGAYRCSVVDISETFRKDVNELLYYSGKEAITNAVLNAKDIPVLGLIDLSEVVPLDPKNIKSIKTGIKALDQATAGSILGDITVWTGRRGEGKSTLISQVMVEAIEQNEKVCCYSGEMRADRFQYWFNMQIAGKKHILSHWDNYRQKDVNYLYKALERKIMDWYKGKMFLYDNSVTSTRTEETGILKIFEYAVRKYDCRLFVVDNLMTAKYNESSERDWYLKQVNFMRDLMEFASCYNVHIHLIAHPKKTAGTLNNDDVSGRSEITNLAHNVISLEKTEDDNKEFNVMLNILKNRWEGSKEKIGLLYCSASRRLYQPSTGAFKQYGWESMQNKQDSIIQTSPDCPF